MSDDPVARASGKSNIPPCPEGPQRLVCCDIVDHGNVLDGFGKLKHKITIIWQSEHILPVNAEYGEFSGTPFLVQRRFTLSLDERAELRKYLESWRGKKFDAQELEGFGLGKLIGANAYAQVIQMQKTRGTFAEVIALMPLPAGMVKLTVSPEYVRMKDPKKDDAAAPAAGVPTTPIPKEDIPF